MGIPCALATTGCPSKRSGGDAPIVTTNASSPAMTVPVAPPGADVVPIAASPYGVPEPRAPWPLSTKSGPTCVAARTPLAAPSLPPPFEHCKDPLSSSATTQERLSPSATMARRATDPDACCYVTFTQQAPHYYEGRPLRADVGVLEAPPVPRDDWCAVLSSEGLRGEAAEWLARAAREHASIASFSRLSLALLAFGAPPDLVLGAHAAAIDEIAHARAAYAVARALGGEALGPGPLATTLALAPPASLVALALETFADGCVNETRAAAAVREEAEAAPPGALRDALLRVASDEERHAELAWRVVAWTLREGGAPVTRALDHALDELEAGAPADAVSRGVVVPCARALLASVPAPDAPSVLNTSLPRSTL